MTRPQVCAVRCFFNDTATTEIYTLSLHDALPIYEISDLGHVTGSPEQARGGRLRLRLLADLRHPHAPRSVRSEEHTSELQSRQYLVCRLLLEKNNTPCPALSARTSSAHTNLPPAR